MGMHSITHPMICQSTENPTPPYTLHCWRGLHLPCGVRCMFEQCVREWVELMTGTIAMLWACIARHPVFRLQALTSSSLPSTCSWIARAMTHCLGIPRSGCTRKRRGIRSPCLLGMWCMHYQSRLGCMAPQQSCSLERHRDHLTRCLGGARCEVHLWIWAASLAVLALGK